MCWVVVVVFGGVQVSENVAVIIRMFLQKYESVYYAPALMQQLTSTECTHHLVDCLFQNVHT